VRHLLWKFDVGWATWNFRFNRLWTYFWKIVHFGMDQKGQKRMSKL